MTVTRDTELFFAPSKVYKSAKLNGLHILKDFTNYEIRIRYRTIFFSLINPRITSFIRRIRFLITVEAYRILLQTTDQYNDISSIVPLVLDVIWHLSFQMKVGFFSL